MTVEKEGSIGVKARSVLWYLTFFGFAINYIIRINVSIAIVDMIDVNYKRSRPSNETVVTCIVETQTNFTTSQELGNEVNLEANLKHISLERRFLDFLEVSHVTTSLFDKVSDNVCHQIEYERDGFKWDAQQQSLVLGSFFWLHWITQLPGGVLAAKYGTKFIFGFSNFIACVLCMFMPIVCYLDFRWMIALRLFQGFITGLAWPGELNLSFFIFSDVYA
jgi:Major Facilitator Superfamily